MIREHITTVLDHDPHFVWRGKSVTRIENLSDIVFALALGMLVSASSPPIRYDELVPHLVNIIPVAAGFTLMVGIWNQHFTYFRRYGVADGRIIALNAILLLFILFIAYPLRFVFDSLFAFILGQFGDWSRMESIGVSTYREAGIIFAWFSVGYACLYLIIQRMYSYALKKRDVLKLSLAEQQITRRSIWRYNIEVLIALGSACLAAFTIVGPFAGCFYVLNWPVASIIDRSIKLPADTESTPQ